MGFAMRANRFYVSMDNDNAVRPIWDGLTEQEIRQSLQQFLDRMRQVYKLLTERDNEITALRLEIASLNEQIATQKELLQAL